MSSTILKLQIYRVVLATNSIATTRIMFGLRSFICASEDDLPWLNTTPLFEFMTSKESPPPRDFEIGSWKMGQTSPGVRASKRVFSVLEDDEESPYDLYQEYWKTADRESPGQSKRENYEV